MEKVIVTAILVIGAVAAALVIVTFVVPSVSRSGQSVAQSHDARANRIETKIEIVGLSFLGNKIEAWVKNLGTAPIHAIDKSDLFLAQPGGSYDVLTYNNDGITPKTWYGDLREAGLPWNRHDTLHITITLSCPDIVTTDYILMMSTPNGKIAEETTSGHTVDCRYLHNNPTPPTGDTASQAVLPMNLVAPTAATLYNYDTDRDSDEALLISKGGSGPGEADLTKTQVWRTAAFIENASLVGTVTISLWAAIKNYDDAKAGEVTVYLRDYNGSTYTEIGNGTVSRANWQSGSSTFVQAIITIPGLSYNIPAGDMLEVKMIVEVLSDDDMWFAYDTSSYATVVQLH